MVKKTYGVDDIKRKAGLLGIRAKATMYIGPTDSSGMWTIWREPADNAADLALKGLNKKVHLIADPNKVGYWVVDDGPGMPVGVKTFENEHGAKEKLNTLYVMTGLTHAGSNFDSDEASRGTHGIGIKATNAMSKLMRTTTFFNGQWWEIEYRDAKLVKEPSKAKAPKLPHGIKITKGTALYFEPDKKLFDAGSKIELQDILDWCDISSYLVPNFEIKYTNAKGKTRTFKTKGIGEYVTKLIEQHKTTQNGKTFIHQDKFCDVVIAFTNAENDTLNAFTNGLKNAEGGVHADTVYAALAKSLKPYQGKLEFQPKDLRDGILGLVNAKIAAPKFNNQKKDGLLDPRAKEVMAEPVLKALTAFWNANKTLAKEICRRAAELRKKTADFLADKKLMKEVKAAKASMHEKFSDVEDKKTPREECELYIVEGDSAGGTAKKARNKKFQATFAIRGKPLNVMEATKDKINKNKEVAGILAGIGADDPNGIRFGKIIFLADPDVDGHHINTLLLTLFHKFVPHLFKEGKVFLLKAPEYYADHNGKTHFGMSIEEVYAAAGTRKCDVRHIKGWGELTPEKMEPVAFDKSTRKLMRVLPPRSSDDAKRFENLMGKNPIYRKKLMGIAA
ncbi:DNA gyrase subunit B protein [Rhizobium phage RHEph12]|nr:DNA gyrase subunit B protein [Rhizobium phage RHEph12]